jgi:hypothetical protein
MNGYGGVTMIRDLPDVGEMGDYGNIHKHIRSQHRMTQGSGMIKNIDVDAFAGAEMPQAGYSTSGGGGHYAVSGEDMDRPVEMPQPPPMQMMPLSPLMISCIDISKHVQDCPICSRFYNNDKTVYIIVIIVLSIICLLLLKKVLVL